MAIVLPAELAQQLESEEFCMSLIRYRGDVAISTACVSEMQLQYRNIL